MRPRYLVAIDPGVQAGLAVFDAKSKRLLLAKVFAPTKGDWDDRCGTVVHDMDQTLRLLSNNPIFTEIVCEYPSFMPSPDGITSARRGDLVKLAYVCGRLHERMRFLGPYRRVSVVEWKGTCSKTLVNERIMKKVAESERSRAGMSPGSKPSHDWDAVSIGMWALENPQ